MRSYLATMIASFGVIFLGLWALLLFDYGAVNTGGYELNKEHIQAIASCHLGDLDVFGDSIVTADLLPSRIAPGMHIFGFSGGTPIETYYLVQAFLKCRNRPKSVILGFAPSSFRDNPNYPLPPTAFYWAGAVAQRRVSFRDAMEILRYSRQFNSSQFIGSPSLFDIDYIVTAFLTSIRFPPYYSTTLSDYLTDVRTGQLTARQNTKSEMYEQTLRDGGHHFYGLGVTRAGEIDHDANRGDYQITRLSDFYFRRTIAALTKAGIEVFLIEPPRDQASSVGYAPDLIKLYQSYLMAQQAGNPRVHLIGDGFIIWDTTLFGDGQHLNLRGALIFSDITRRALIGADQPAAIYDATEMESNNIYAAASPATFWTNSATGDKDEITQADAVALQDLAYPSADGAWLFKPPAMTISGKTSAIQAPPIVLKANTHYAASVFIRNVNASKVTLLLKWPGGSAGSVTWAFDQQKLIYSGMSNDLNSSVSICPGGWIQLFISGKTGTTGGSYPGPALMLSRRGNASAYIGNISVEEGLWPTDYCTLQPGESKVISPGAQMVMTAN